MFGNVLATEFLKLRRCKVTWATLGVMSIAPVALALFMWIVRQPERASQLGLLGAKANLSGIQATWPYLFYMLTLVIGFGGALLLAYVVAYVFGREYAEMTAKNMLALPVGRQWFVIAKFVVAAVWWLVLVVVVLAEGFVVGLLMHLPGLSAQLTADSVRNVLLAAGLAYLLVPPVAWITTLGRGYMPPLAFAMVMLVLGNILGKTGWAAWFPWSIVPMLVGAVGQPVSALPTGSYIVIALTFGVGVLGTVAQVRFADNAQ